MKRNVFGAKNKNPIKSSVLIGAVKKFTDFVYVSVSHSILGKIFSGYENEGNLTDKSFFAGEIGKLGINEKNKKIKLSIMRHTENSFFHTVFGDVEYSLLSSPLKNYGIMALIFIFTVLLFRFSSNDVSFSGFLSSPVLITFFIVSLVCAVAFMLSKTTLAESVLRSRIVSYLMFNLLGVHRERFEKATVGKNHFALPIFFGIGFGALCALVTPRFFIIGAVVFIAALLILRQPETGVLIELLILPFAPAKVTFVLVTFTFTCYITKLFRGKRTFKYGLLDVTIILFALVLFLGCLFSLNSLMSFTELVKIFPGIILFFLIVNLMKNSDWVNRCYKILLLTSAFIILLSLYDTLLSYLGLPDRVFNAIRPSPILVQTDTILVQLLVLAAPLILSGIATAKNILRKIFFIMLFASTVFLAIHVSDPAVWIAILVSIILYLLIVSKVNLVFVIFLAVAFLLFTLLFPNEFKSFSETFTTGMVSGHRSELLPAVLQMMRSVFIGGTGLGCFSLLYQSYTLENIPTATTSGTLYFDVIVELGIVGLLVMLIVFVVYAQSSFTYYQRSNEPIGKKRSASFFSAVIGMLVLGFFNNIFYDFRIFIAVFVFMALGNAIRRNAKRENHPVSSDEIWLDLNYWRGEISANISDKEREN